jgi:hypothetical protein
VVHYVEMDPEEPVPEADAQEQAGADEGVAPDVPIVGEKPEADALEQALPVDEGRVRVVSSHPDEVSEADWLEQSVVEPLDDEEPR